MGIAQKMVDYLRSREITEKELVRMYTDFGEGIYTEGFNVGCEFVRGVIRKQKACRKQSLKNKYNKFLTELDDHLHTI